MKGDSPDNPARAPRQASFWALAALVCAVASACPIAALLGIVLGGAALLDIRLNPHRGGRRLAVTAIIVGGIASAGWGAFGWWWHVNVRTPMLHGPAPALRAGLDGDVAAFRDAFVNGGGDEVEAATFLTSVRNRYGALVGAAQRADDGSVAARNTDVRQPWIPYAFRFESGRLDADAQFIVVEPGQGLILKFAWVAIRDPQLGDLVYPAAATAASQAPPPLPEGPVPVEEEPPGGQ